MNMSSIVRARVVLLILVGLGLCSVGCWKQQPPPGTCEACGTVNDLSANFCAGCGSSLVESCPNCSAEIRVGVRFCPECGGDVEAIRAEEARRAEEFAAYKAAGDLVVDLGSGVELLLVEIKPGRFMMGSPASEQGRDGDETQYQVTISKPFWLGETEVTQAQWHAVMGSNPSYRHGDLDRTAAQVSWNDAQEFCRRLSQKSGMAFRLPTEAEWEYACRAGTTTAYSFGDDSSRLGEYAWFKHNSVYDTIPVATKKPNAWGLYDMHGSMWEWCSDWWGDYLGGAVTDPQGPRSGTKRVLRGGSWNSISSSCRAAFRFNCGPDGSFGFRVARTPASDSWQATTR